MAQLLFISMRNSCYSVFIDFNRDVIRNRHFTINKCWYDPFMHSDYIFSSKHYRYLWYHVRFPWSKWLCWWLKRTTRNQSNHAMRQYSSLSSLSRLHDSAVCGWSKKDNDVINQRSNQSFYNYLRLSHLCNVVLTTCALHLYSCSMLIP